MSRIGKKPVAMPSGVSANVEGQTLTVKGPKGSLSMALLNDLVTTTIDDDAISLQPIASAQRSRAAGGWQRPQVQILVSGVTASTEGQTLTVKGPKGSLSMAMLNDLVAYQIDAWTRQRCHADD